MEDLWNNLREILPGHGRRHCAHRLRSTEVPITRPTPRPLLTLAREISNRQKPAILLLDVNEGLYFKYFYWKKKRLQSGEQAGGVNFARHVTILNRNPKSTRIWRTGGIIKMLLPVSLDWIALTVYCKKSWQRSESNECWQCFLPPWKIRCSMEK
jgi:hypothetical protein